MIKTHGNQEVSSLTALKPKSKRWHLDPVSVTKIEKKPHSVSEVKESHSVFSNLNGNKHGFKQEHKQGRFDLIKNKVGFNISMRLKKKSLKLGCCSKSYKMLPRYIKRVWTILKIVQVLLPSILVQWAV